MRYQAEFGDVDFITGDYLAEVNIAENAQAHAAGHHPGWEQTCWDGLEQTIEILAKKRIKVVVNGGAHNPKGLAEKVQQLVRVVRRENFYDSGVRSITYHNLSVSITHLAYLDFRYS
jgi:hypothetical protein